MPDTTPQNLKRIREWAAIRSYATCRHRGLEGYVFDLLAMIDALEAQVRDLTKPEEDVAPADLNCVYCAGRGWCMGRNLDDTAARWINCPRCNPAKDIPLPNLRAR